MESHTHSHEHELLYASCTKCGNDAMIVAIMDGALLLTCADCEAECGIFEDLATETRLLLQEGCKHNGHDDSHSF